MAPSFDLPTPSFDLPTMTDFALLDVTGFDLPASPGEARRREGLAPRAWGGPGAR